MQHEMIFAGFGGQGVLLIGKMIAYAGLASGKEVCWLPSYGPEMRGGTANCTVVVSDEAVGSPVVATPWSVVAMNLPSLDKFEPVVAKGGVLLVNTSLINRPVVRSDVKVVNVAANEICNELGNPKGANMVVLGTFVGATDVVPVDKVEDLIRDTFSKKPALIDVNLTCFRRGLEVGRSQKAV
ncbi:MAG TPA: 2-oxoacid:acceptor oxidoreductase family protein [Myxococcota bacterium]|nr:2-oxoacid:acceptor oxidoreductase family protein [Kiritimatiellia bacterium]HNZ04043.1 2-oxoacid:acceptor oxidoreductase family protein [Myxococcota bacterium]HPB51329.1 2-oxoacid:acceptor oxidoreductase family protein [Myxococcota bacterium]HQP96293.1 2-oxoacid:acceptor oxidoreductase family protein [Myxococcota bacterium]